MKLIIGIVVLIIGVFLFLRMRGRRAPIDDAVKAESRDTARLKADFHAVSIRPGAFACKAARELEGERFLSGTAPRIPLPDCDASDCSCRFAHHDDRRAGDDRRSPFPPTIGLDAGSTGQDQRSDSDRRRKTRN
ncbi:MAG TPA: hypothetical protein VNQ14_12535 [Woeseiaceae bacterium]|nr:hypothetical protein [Woeseiaceae bacterium]